MVLEGRVALVTGAASGIGKAIVRRFAQAGARVVVADIGLDAATATAREIGGPQEALAVAMDVTDETQVNEGVAKAVAAFGGVDVLVSNAGIQIVHPLEEFSITRGGCERLSRHKVGYQKPVFESRNGRTESGRRQALRPLQLRLSVYA